MKENKIIELLHESIVNGQYKQAYNQICEYDMYDFFDDYSAYLFDSYCALSAFEYLRKAINIYMRTINR